MYPIYYGALFTYHLAVLVYSAYKYHFCHNNRDNNYRLHNGAWLDLSLCYLDYQPFWWLLGGEEGTSQYREHDETYWFYDYEQQESLWFMYQMLFLMVLVPFCGLFSLVNSLNFVE